MYKLFSAAQIRNWDKYTIAHEPVSSIDLMERATEAFCETLMKEFSFFEVDIFCGQGNNGGDGLALARMLAQLHKKVRVHIIHEKPAGTVDFETNLLKLHPLAEVVVHHVYEKKDFQNIAHDSIIVDALIGTGLKGNVKGLTKEIIEHINSFDVTKVAVDVPSGLLCDEPLLPDATVICANYTFTFQCMKLAFLFSENQKYCGNVRVLDIGLSNDFYEKEKTNYFITTSHSVSAMLPKRLRFSHKGNHGHALLLAGASGKFGAALLAAKSCLRSGAGLVTVHSANTLEMALNSYLPTAMFSADSSRLMITELPPFDKYNAVAAGCGIGLGKETCSVIKLLIQQCNVPLVLDADAINILAENKTWLAFLPAGTILTPHPKEFERLCGKWNDSFERLKMQKDFSAKFQCYMVFKGAYTCVTTPSGNCYFNTSGNPGMAKGGSGDTLTGIITALLAQGLNRAEACVAAVYIHGVAGDLAKQKYGELSMLPEDLTEQLGPAFELISNSSIS